jgi:Rrf2 family protein
MLITKKTDYAIRAFCSIAQNGRRIVAVSQLSNELGIPRPYLRGILQLLRKNGLLRSYRGRGGGFELALPPSKILVADLVRVFQGPVKFDRCIFKERICPDIETCVLREEIKSMERGVVERLESITIESLLQKERRRKKNA